MAGYIRQSTFADGDTITATLFNNEYNQLLNVFSNTGGHKHDGTAAEGPVIGLIGDAGVVTPLNKVLIDSTNDHIEFWIDVSSSSVQQLYIADGAIVPVTDSDVDLGTTGLRFKDAYIDTVTTTGNVAVGGNLTVTGTTTFNGGTITMGDAATDNVVFGADVDSNIIPDDDDTYDLGSASQEWRNLYIDGTANIDSLVADTADINGGTIDGAIIGGSSAAAITGTTITGTAITGTSFVIGSANITEAELEILDGATVTTDELNILDGVTATATEINLIDGVTATTDELNLLDGVTSTTAELNILDGVTSTATELNLLDGVTSTTAELNILDGVTASAADINLIDGITNGTVIASKAIITDVNKDITGGRNITISGELDAGSLDVSGNVDVDGTLETDALSINGTAVTSTAAELNLLDGKAFLDEDNMASNSATGIASQQSIKAYVDSQVTAQDLDLTDGTTSIAIDLDSEALSVLGGTGVTSTASGNGVTLAIDSTVATLTGTQTLTNKTLTSPDVNTPDIDGGTVDGSVIGGTTPAAGTFTTLTANTSITGTLATAAQTNITSVGTLSALTVTGEITANGGIALGDSDIATFGASDDLQIYHNGSNSFIDDTGTGSLFVRADATIAIKSLAQDEYYIKCVENDTVELYNNGSKKLATTATGIDVTGTATMDGLTVDGTGGLTIDNSAVNGAMTITNPSADLIQFTTGTNDDISFVRSGSERLGINATGIDVTGTATMDGLTVDLADNAGVLIQSPNDSSTAFLKFGDATSSDSGSISYDHYSDALRFKTINTTRMILANNGDISFYNTAGNSQALFWDASATSLGIGTTSPAGVLHANSSGHTKTYITGGTSNDAQINFGDSDDNDIGGIHYDNAQNSMKFLTNTEIRMTLDSSGSVGIGTTSPAYKLEVESSSDADLIQIQSTAGANNTVLRLGISGDVATINASGGSSGALALKTYGTERMRITPTGSLGIGTTNPTSKLHIATTGSEEIGIGLQNSQRYYGIQTAGGALTIKDVSAGGTERMRITSAGLVGIGDTAPAVLLSLGAAGSEKLHVYHGGDVKAGFGVDLSGGSRELSMFHSTTGTNGLISFGKRLESNGAYTEVMRIDGSGSINLGVTAPTHQTDSLVIYQPDNYALYSGSNGTGGSNHMVFGNANGWVGSITTNGSATQYLTSSDYRLKENVDYDFTALDRVAQLKPARFNFIADEDTTVDGFIAHEVASVIPEAITGEKDAVNDEGNPVMQGIDQSKLVPLLTKAIQEQQTQIEALQSEINELKNS